LILPAIPPTGAGALRHGVDNARSARKGETVRRIVRFRPQHSIVVVAMVAALLVTTSSASTANVAAQQGKVDKTGVLRFALALADQGGVSFDPGNLTGSPANVEWMDLIYDVMIHETKDGKGSPGLATKWSAIDASTVELTLREGVKFSDGTPFNAAAVKESWTRAINANQSVDDAQVRAMTSVDAVDDRTVRVHFSLPVAQPFLENTVRHSSTLAVPSPTASASGSLNSKPVGAGPYVLKDFTQDQKVTLSKNPSYWNPKAQLLNGIEFQHAATGTPAINALRSGVADLIWGIPADSLVALENDPSLKVTSVPSARVLNMVLCPTDGVFASKDARQAMQYAIDRDEIDEGAFGGLAQPWQAAVGPTSPFYDKKFNETYSYNPKKAKQLLKKAGVAPGTTITGLINSAAPFPVVAEILKAQLEKVGLNFDYTVTTDFVGDALRVKHDLITAALDPAFWGIAFGTQPTVLNPCAWQNAQLSADLITMQDPGKTAEERKKAGESFQQILLEESPMVMTVVSPLTTAHAKNVRGIETITIPYGPNLSTVYMTK
jgi:ABC-type transport system substrate-binding protein